MYLYAKQVFTWKHRDTARVHPLLEAGARLRTATASRPETALRTAVPRRRPARDPHGRDSAGRGCRSSPAWGTRPPVTRSTMKPATRGAEISGPIICPPPIEAAPDARHLARIRATASRATESSYLAAKDRLMAIRGGEFRPFLFNEDRALLIVSTRVRRQSSDSGLDPRSPARAMSRFAPDRHVENRTEGPYNQARLTAPLVFDVFGRRVTVLRTEGGWQAF